MTLAQLDTDQRPGTSQAGPPEPARTVDWRRLRTPVAMWSLGACAVAAVGTSLGTLVAGRLAEDATTRLVLVLAVCVVGAALDRKSVV